MAELTLFQRNLLERFFKMQQGYVLEFSNRTFTEFVIESIKIDPYDSKYDLEFASASKANRLRGILKFEKNYKVGVLIQDLANQRYHLESESLSEGEIREYHEILKVAAYLKSDRIVDNIDAIKENVEEMDFSVLAKSIRESIEKNEPETALDRLHTYTFHFMRRLCKKHKIDFTKEETLNAITGKYIKYLVERKLIETVMTQRILKTSISLMESFNDVRNNRSLAHPNSVLNYDESIVIFNSISNTIRFIQTIEEKCDRNIKEAKKREEERQTKDGIDDLPF